MGDPEPPQENSEALFDAIVDRQAATESEAEKENSEVQGSASGAMEADMDAFTQNDDDEELFAQAIAQSQY